MDPLVHDMYEIDICRPLLACTSIRYVKMLSITKLITKQNDYDFETECQKRKFRSMIVK